MADDVWTCAVCGEVEIDHFLKMKSDPKHSIHHAVIDAEFVPNAQSGDEQQDLDAPIPPPMSAKEFKQHCARIAKDSNKGMATRMAAFGLGTLTEMFLDAAGEVLGTGKKPTRKRLSPRTKEKK